MELQRKEDQRSDDKQPRRDDQLGRDNDRQRDDIDGNRCSDEQHGQDNNRRYPVLRVDLEAIRENRSVIIEGLREDAFTLEAEIVEVGSKPSAPGGSRKNWSGQIVEFEDRGVRVRAIAALGSQDIGSAMQLVPLDPGVTVIAGSSDHTVLDVTDSGREWKPGNTVSFRAYYMPLLYCFATRHVSIMYK